MRVAVLVGVMGVIACGPGLKRLDTREVGRQALLDSSGDAAAIEKLLSGSVVHGGLRFENPVCATQFPGGEIRADRLAAFAGCLAELHLQPSAREDALGDVVVMTYAPGFEVEVRVVQELSGLRLTWIGFSSRRPTDFGPTVTVDALEALRLTGDRNGPLDPSVAATLELDQTPTSRAAFSWIKVCIDASGKVVDASPFETTSSKASDAFASAARAWTFRPFTIGGQALPVCSMARMAYPPNLAASVETLPMPPPPSKGKKKTIVFAEGAMRQAGKRISGEKHIAPDRETQAAIRDVGVRHAIGSFRLCLDETGHVESVLPMRSTGFANYDRTLMSGMRTWVYSPYVVGGEPVPVCTAITFNYTQR